MNDDDLGDGLPTPKRKRKISILRNLRLHEVSLVDRGANPHAAICIYKTAYPGDADYPDGHHEEAAMTQDDVYELMLKRQARLGNDWPSDDPEWRTLYALYKRAPVAEAEPVEKSAAPGDSTWRVIEKRAHALMAEAEAAGVTLGEAAAIETVCVENPGLYVRYRDELLAG